MNEEQTTGKSLQTVSHTNSHTFELIHLETIRCESGRYRWEIALYFFTRMAAVPLEQDDICAFVGIDDKVQPFPHFETESFITKRFMLKYEW